MFFHSDQIRRGVKLAVSDFDSGAYTLVPPQDDSSSDRHRRPPSAPRATTVRRLRFVSGLLLASRRLSRPIRLPKEHFSFFIHEGETIKDPLTRRPALFQLFWSTTWH